MGSESGTPLNWCLQSFSWSRKNTVELTGSSCAKLFTICIKSWSSVDRYRTPSGLAIRVVKNEQPSFTQRIFAYKTKWEIGHAVIGQHTLALLMSAKRWLKGRKKDINRLTNLETLIASSSRLGFSKGPSITACNVSKFHLVWSFVVMTWIYLV